VKVVVIVEAISFVFVEYNELYL